MEAVRVWTSIAGTITSFTKYVLQAFPEGTFHRGDRERILAFLVAFPVSLKRELRGERDLRELKSVLSGPDLAKLQNADSMPSYCLYILSAYCLHAKAQESRLPQTFIVVRYYSSSSFLLLQVQAQYLFFDTPFLPCPLQMSRSISLDGLRILQVMRMYACKSRPCQLPILMSRTCLKTIYIF